MKKNLKTRVIVSILTLGLFAIPSFSLSSNTAQPQQQMGMQGMGMQGNGMMGNQSRGQMGCSGMMGGTMMNRMSPDQQQTFMNQTTDQRKKMMDLRFDYQETMRNPDSSPQDLASIEKQMLDLRTQMMGKMKNLQSQ